MKGDPRVKAWSRGCFGWYELIEVVDPDDRVRVGGYVYANKLHWRVVRVAPPRAGEPTCGGVLVLAEISKRPPSRPPRASSCSPA